MANAKFKLSVVVVVYDMSRQAMNTLFSLSTTYQRNVDASDYEIIVVENSSQNNLDQTEVESLAGNYRYILRDEKKPTPIYAVNHGIEISNGENICLMIDGARLLTPRVIRYTLDAFAINSNALVAIPGYHIGKHDHKFNHINLHNEKSEQQLLDSINWQSDGYGIFDVSCFSGANTHGYLHPLLESNCLSVSKESLLRYGGANEEFESPGGGAVNLDLYRGLCLDQTAQLFVVAGEGSFHQYHGGVTTMQRDDLDQLLNHFQDEYTAINGENYQAARREPTLIGAITSKALPYLQLSLEGAQRRFLRFADKPNDAWRDDY
jgi:hypothetical protein